MMLAAAAHLVGVLVELEVGVAQHRVAAAIAGPPARRSTARIRATTSSRLNGLVT